MLGTNATLKCHPMSGDFAYSNQYTLTIDDNLNEAQDRSEWFVS